MNTNEKKYWNKKAWIYNKMFDTTKQYQEMYGFIRSAVSADMRVLEVGTGTGMIAREIADNVKWVQATDFSPQMIEKAKSIEHSKNIEFSCADIFNLPFQDERFEAVIASNILHIIPNPESALQEIKRVLKPQGVFIAPTFLWLKPSFGGRIKRLLMRLNGFPLYSKWDETLFSKFIQANGFEVGKTRVINGSFRLCYLEAIKK